MKKPLTYISLFSSAGVGCFGFKEQGFECIATNELLEKRLKIQKYNQKCHFDSGYINGDITSTEVKNQLFKEIEHWKTIYKTENIVDVIIATPPCQGMSVANHKKNDELGRNSLVVQSIHIVKDVNPKIFIFENVKAFLNTICTDLDLKEKKIEDAINENLAGQYNILGKIINFKDYGSNSSRTRTLVIGVRKDLQYITPYDLFPSEKFPLTLRNLFNNLPKLSTMGEISENDIFHSFREYDKRMLPWIENLSEGQSAFDNTDKTRIPHQIKDGVIIYNQNKNGDKYARWFWDREGPCIHTRNDILASQNTIHPSENRVFSIRELMLMMTIPDHFKWSEKNNNELNSMNLTEKKAFLKKEELNIRHCIGEAVPTAVMDSIASNIKQIFNKKILSLSEIKKIVSDNKLYQENNLIDFIENNFHEITIENIFNIVEVANLNKEENAAFFTRSDIVFSMIKSLPDFKNKKQISILEPSVGVGNFIPSLIQKYKHKDKVDFYLCDIDKKSINILKLIIKKMDVAGKFNFHFINDDFLIFEHKLKYDLIIGNPPYKKLSKENPKLKEYKKNLRNCETNNIFSFFIEKSINLGKYISFITPKSLINAPEFNITRKLILEQNLIKICDYGEKAFKNVKIETISFLLSTNLEKKQSITIESYIKNSYTTENKNYIFSQEFPYWLIYRNSKFDNVSEKLNFGVFNCFRDRQITKSMTKKTGRYRVLKSRNIANNEILDLANYDCYIDEIDNLAVKKYLNMDNIVMIPNLTYNPRAAFLPKNTLTDGSIALLNYKFNDRTITEKDLAYYATEEFEQFYRIARNYGTRSLNIDNNSVFFFGILKD